MTANGLAGLGMNDLVNGLSLFMEKREEAEN